MRRALLIVFVLALVIGGLVLVSSTGNGSRQDVSVLDDFSGPAGSAPNPSLWKFDVGGGGWGNKEIQRYTDDRTNASLNGAGQLVISARNSGAEFTSARLTTKGTFAFTYGTLDARIRMPAGAGLHPAFWLLGTDIDSVGYPASGEIDVAESVNAGTSWHTAVHGPTQAGTHWQLNNEGALSPSLSGYHVYGVHREPDQITISIDGTVVSTYSRGQLDREARWVFDQPMYVLLNLAVGGSWPGPPNAATPDPALMLVDWVRYSP